MKPIVVKNEEAILEMAKVLRAQGLTVVERTPKCIDGYDSQGVLKKRVKIWASPDPSDE